MKLVHKYALFSGILVAGFTNFIACGAQMYKVSLEEDHEPSQTSELAQSSNQSSQEFGLHAPNGWRSLPIPIRMDPTLEVTQVRSIKDAMATWEIATGRKLFNFQDEKNTKTGDFFADLFGSLEDQLNGNYFLHNWSKTKKAKNVLATTIWNNEGDNYKVISTADIHYNSDLYYLADSLKQAPVDKREIVDLRSLALHEVGHFLGLAHIDDEVDLSIMNPAIMIGAGLSSRSLSVGDVKRIQKIYGCQGSACDADATARKILQLTGVSDLSSKASLSLAH